MQIYIYIYTYVLSSDLFSSVFLVQTVTENKKMCQQVLALEKNNASTSK